MWERLRWFHPMGVTTPLVREPRPLDAAIVARKRKNFADFLRKSFLVKIFAFWPPAALRGPSRGGNVARCIAMGTTVPLAKPLPMVAYPVATVSPLPIRSV